MTTFQQARAAGHLTPPDTTTNPQTLADELDAGLCECGCGGRTRIATKTDRMAGQVKGQHIRFISGHNLRLVERPLPNPPAWDVVDCGFRTPCWLWRGSRIAAGYGQVTPGPDRPRMYAHRWSYEHHVGPIPDGLVIDHLCSNPPCVNPGHLEPVTPAVNAQRGRRAKLTPAAVRFIRASSASDHEVARSLGIDHATVWQVRNGYAWRNVA